MRPTRRFLFLLPWLSLLLASACGPGTAEDSSGTPEPTPADAGAIHAVDFELLPATQTLLQQLGSGRVAGDGVLFADLTGDRRDEAVVPVTSDGTLGNLAYLVFTMASGKPATILARSGDRTTAGGLAVSVEDGQLEERAGVFGPSDPLCCPAQLRITTFRWDGAQLRVEREETEEQSSAKQ